MSRFTDLRVFSGSSHPELTDSICAHLGITPGKREIIRFSNENLLVQIEESVRESDVFVVQTSCPPVNEHIMEELILIDALKRASAARITAVLPYFPYVRSDKKDKPRIPITARLMADLLEAAGADRVVTMDLHSPQIQGFFKIPLDHLQAAPLLADFVRKRIHGDNAVVVASDAGEAKDAASFASRLNLDIAIIDKRRTAHDENAIAANLIGDVKGKVAILIDDEVASGGTLVQATEFLHREGATKVIACATHAVFTGNAPERLRNSGVTEMAVTNTLPVGPEKRFDGLEVISVAGLFADAIRRIHTGESVSTLFQ